MGLAAWLARLVAVLICIARGQTSFQDVNIATITRDNTGDVFVPKGIECNPDTCVGISSGTASISRHKDKTSKESFCECQCHQHLPVFREDLRICVDDLKECALAPFVSSSTAQQIPFVYLPLKGQIIHPSKEIKFSELREPICAVSSAKILTENGWVEIRNPSDGDIPLRLFRDEGKIFLQWTGDSQQRIRMQGRLVLIYIFCREISSQESTIAEPPVVFTPCVSFRVAGRAIRSNHNISEVSFSDESHLSDNSGTGNLSVSEYIAIGICSILLAFVYVASVLLYLHLRRKRKGSESKSTSNESQNFNTLEGGIVKSNPLLSFDKNFQGSESNYSDSVSTDTDNGDVFQCYDDKRNKKVQTSALVHLQKQDFLTSSSAAQDLTYQDSSAIEKLPEENVSIVETTENREDQVDSLKAFAGSTRKKLYFNPAYFEPQLLVAPPPAAIEFLTKIREVMTIAKQKMASKRFVPSLNNIPEEDSFEQIYEQSRSIKNSRKNSVISLKRQNSRRKTCPNCSGCESQEFNDISGKLPDFPFLGACQNCVTSNESKQRIIEKWLDEIPCIKTDSSEDWSLKNGYYSEETWRVRSPTRSLPSTIEPSPSTRCLSPKPVSESGISSRVALPYHQKPVRHTNWRKPKAPAPPISENTETSSSYQKIDTNKTTVAKATFSVSCSNQNDFRGNRKENAVTKNESTPQLLYKNNLSVDGSSIPNPIQASDYETDSLERSPRPKGCTSISDSENASSQPSPSLSTALPMEEELTITNAVINPKDDTSTSPINNENINDSDYHLTVLKTVRQKVMDASFYSLPELIQNNSNNGYNLVSEVYVNNGYSFGSASSSPNNSPRSTLEKRKPTIKYIEPESKPGQLLIEVEDCPDNYIKVNDQDFEPDTLDRKPSKGSKNISENMSKIQLRTTGSFKTTGHGREESQTKLVLSRTFRSLREIYESKGHRKSLQRSNLTNSSINLSDYSEDFKYGEGVLLSLEERHKKRQRRFTFTGPNNVPPDVIPPSSHKSLPIYDFPTPPQKVKNFDPLVTSQTKTENTSKKQINDLKKDSNGITVIDFNHRNIYENCKNGLFCNYFEENNEDCISGENGFISVQISDLHDGAKNHAETKDGDFKVNRSNSVGSLSRFFQLKSSKNKPEDSGYLSNDSNDYLKKRTDCTEPPVNDDGESETDDSLGDGQSESGAESVETHSVFFGSYYGNGPCFRNSVDSGVGFDAKANERLLCAEEGDGSDSEAMSYATVVPVQSVT